MFPNLFIGSIVLPSYWTLVVIGIIAGFLSLYVTTRNLARNNRNKLFLLAVLIFIPFVGGSALTRLHEILTTDSGLCTGKSGFSLWFGILVATASAFPACRAMGVNVWLAADHFSISISIGGFFARLGCLMNGCCFGNPCPADFPLATFFSQYSEAGTVFPDKPLFPVQLFSSLSWLLVYFVLIFKNKTKNFEGQLILLMAMIYSVLNFFIEIIRYHHKIMLLSQSQCISIAVFTASALIYIKKANPRM